MKLFELVNAEQAIGKLVRLELPVSKAWSITKFLKLVREELATYNEVRKTIVSKHAKPETIENNQVEIDPANAKAFQDDMNELLQRDVEINFEKIKLSDIEGGKMTPLELDVLSFLFEE